MTERYGLRLYCLVLMVKQDFGVDQTSSDQKVCAYAKSVIVTSCLVSHHVLTSSAICSCMYPFYSCVRWTIEKNLAHDTIRENFSNFPPSNGYKFKS